MRPVHFEIQSPDPAASQGFFGRVFGWTYQKYGDFPYWLANTGPDDEAGINGALMPPEDGQPRTVLVMDTPDISAAVESIAEEGGEVVTPINEIPGVGKVAYCHDPHGVLFGVFESAQMDSGDDG